YMSGGLDSRMTTWVAKELGYKNITNMCYSKNNSTDEKAAKNVASYLKNEFIFKSLDDLNFIYDIDLNTKMNFGMAEYFGITGGRGLLSDINFQKYGLEHTGQLGDVVLSSFCHTPYHSTPDESECRFSDLLNCDYTITNQFENHEQYCMYVRGFQAALSTHCIRRNYTEAVSPFLDIDFFSLCMSIPLKYRYNHKLYWNWIEKKYPDAAKIISTRKKKNKNFLTIIKMIIKFIFGKKRKILIAMLKNIGMGALFLTNMNPFDYWYKNNPDISRYYDEYFLKNIELFNNFEEIKQKSNLLFEKGNVSEKAMVLTLLSAYKLYFENNDKIT
ncbi:MAG: asparagine synthase, partial [Saccharofermentanales bacterium]